MATARGVCTVPQERRRPAPSRTTDPRRPGASGDGLSGGTRSGGWLLRRTTEARATSEARTSTSEALVAETLTEARTDTLTDETRAATAFDWRRTVATEPLATWATVERVRGASRLTLFLPVVRLRRRRWAHALHLSVNRLIFRPPGVSPAKKRSSMRAASTLPDPTKCCQVISLIGST